MKFKNVSLLLALVMILSSLSVTVFAANDDNVVVSSLGNLIGNNKGITVETVYDATLMKNVTYYSSESYCSTYDTWNYPGNEPGHQILTAAGLIADKSHKYMTIGFDIYIENATDGIGFRAERANAEETITAATYYYIGIGGSEFKAGGASTCHKIANTGLSVGKWHRVVIQIGVDGTDNTVRFYIDDVLNASNTVTSGVTHSDGVITLPDNTFGWGGSSLARCAVIPKGIKSSPFGMKLSDFVMKETNTAYTTGSAINKILYKLEDNSAFDGKKIVTRTTNVNAPHFNEGSKKVSHYTTEAESYTNSSASKEPVHKMLTSAGSFGGIDWSKYKNMRIQFNVYISEPTESIYFRFERSVDGTTYARSTGEYNFIVGGTDAGDPTTGTHVYYKGLSEDRWHNVVMELGANKDNNYIRYYIDGEPVTPSQTQFTDANDYYGWGGHSTNFAVVSMKNRKAPMSIYLSDLTVYASNTNYADVVAPKPSVEISEDAVAFMDSGVIYGPKSLANEALVNTNADLVNIDADNSMILVYNDASKQVKYYDFVNGGLHLENKSFVYSPQSKKFAAKATAYNFEDEDKAIAMVIAMYKNDDKGVPTLVDIKRFYKTFAPSTKNEIAEYKATEITNDDATTTPIDFDYAKLFYWDDLSDSRTPNGEALEATK